jgi:hypothetical protein
VAGDLFSATVTSLYGNVSWNIRMKKLFEVCFIEDIWLEIEMQPARSLQLPMM